MLMVMVMVMVMMTREGMKMGSGQGTGIVSGMVPGMQSTPGRLVRLVTVLVLGLAVVPAWGSEFPERECCDSIPPLPAQFTTPPVSVATSSSRTPSSTQRSTAAHLTTVSATINCKLARQMCVNDNACYSITTLVPRLCGQELVACSTTTVTKCTAALRTLVAFQFFQPTCLCKQPRIDPECNTYRSLVFDHPCFTVSQKDKDPYPVHALPECEYALEECLRTAHCSRLYENFVRSCDFRDSRCLMTDSRACYNAWNQLRLSPVFGCFCPDNTAECRRIFHLVHRNPCVDDLPEHRRNASWHSTQHRLHRLLLPPRRASAPAPPAHAPRTPPSRTVASSRGRATRGPAAPSPGRVSVDELAGAALGGVRRPADPLLVTPLWDAGSERAHNSTLRQTLHGPADRRPDVRLRHPPRHHVSISQSPPTESVFQSSCHEARESCLEDPHCRSKLHPVLSACRELNCDRGICMQRLQNFYRAANTNLSMEVALCVCRTRRGSDGGECVRALEELHPRCAQEPEEGVLPACHSVAERCLADPSGSCRPRLERYVQDCAVDPVTDLCEGPTAHCRAALLAVLGTELRTKCSCKGTDSTSWYSCTGWHRLLFDNKCVVQAQLEFHQQRLDNLRTPPPILLPPPSPPPPEPTHPRPSTTTPVTQPRRTTPARSTTTARHQPEEHCVIRKPGRPEDRVPVGDGIRYYKIDDYTGRHQAEHDCSEVCLCPKANLPTCHVLECVERRQCETTAATYHDGSPGLLPYRAGCVCFHGAFICMRPPADLYTLPFGVFLFLGYSRKEEELLRERTDKTVLGDTLPELSRVLDRITRRDRLSLGEQKWSCKLSVKQIFEETENIIIQAKIDDVEDSYNNSLSKESLDREKRECVQPLREVSFLINNREPAILSHPLLSVFKIADVDVTIPDTSGSPPRATNAALAPVFVAAALLVR